MKTIKTKDYTKSKKLKSGWTGKKINWFIIEC